MIDVLATTVEAALSGEQKLFRERQQQSLQIETSTMVVNYDKFILCCHGKLSRP